MSWLSLLKGLLSLSSSLLSFLKRRKLIEAGKALQIAEGLKYAQDAIKEARHARRGALREFDKRDGVPDDTDPNLRD